MGLKMIRQPSETPNVSNIDDIIPFRYAYGNQDGYIIGRGLELEKDINGTTFTVQQGRVVLQGVETEVDANGVSFNIENTSQLRYYSVYYYVSLGQNITEIKIRSSTSGYPALQKTSDLTIMPSGESELELYRFTAQNGVISNVEKVVKPIEYMKNVLVEKSKDVTDSINGKALTEIFENDGVTTKNATNAIKTSFTNNTFKQVSFSSTINDFKSDVVVLGYITDLQLQTNLSGNTVVFTQKSNSTIELGVFEVRNSKITFIQFSGIFTRSSDNKEYVMSCLLQRNTDGSWIVYRVAGGNISYSTGNIDNEGVKFSSSVGGWLVYKIIK